MGVGCKLVQFVVYSVLFVMMSTNMELNSAVSEEGLAWISSDYFESLSLPQLLRGENDSKQSDEVQAKEGHVLTKYVFFSGRKLGHYADQELLKSLSQK